MKQTLLDLTQQTLNKMSSDEVNSIGDTVESMQVANEIKTTYYSMIGNLELPYQYNLVALLASGDTSKPTHMTVPENVDSFKWIQYNKGTPLEPEYVEIDYLTPEQFVIKCSKYEGVASPLVVQDNAGSLVIATDKQPQWYTLFDDTTVVFDSYDASVDDTLQESKARMYAQTIPTWSMTDDFIPDLPAKYFPQLLAEASQACMVYLKQTNSPIDQMRARQQYVRHFNNRNRKLGSQDSVLDFGRS